MVAVTLSPTVCGTVATAPSVSSVMVSAPTTGSERIVFTCLRVVVKLFGCIDDDDISRCTGGCARSNVKAGIETSVESY